MKRIMLAGTGSGCGKTTVTCALLQALTDRGMNVSSFKCGPDYIDPMFHKTVIGADAHNLDSYLMTDDAIRYLLHKNSGEISVIEGVMGFYDGFMSSGKGSSCELSQITDTSVILIVNCAGMSRSAAAVVKGFKDFAPNNIAGVIFNNMPEKLYGALAAQTRAIGVEPLGFLPRIKEAKIDSRHLGLITAPEITDLGAKLRILADYARRFIDIDRILEIAERADLHVNAPVINKTADVTLALARDKAFCFCYEDNLDLLRSMGARIAEFSPLANEEVPDCDGLILCGGYPELYADKLEKNTVTLRGVREKIADGAPCIAECGGFMYLHETLCALDGQTHKMAGVIKGVCRAESSLQHFGYMEMTALRDNVLCEKGHKIRAREFHYFKSSADVSQFSAQKGDTKWDCAYADANLFASFAHLHFYSDISIAENFVKSCEEYKCTK